MNLRHKRVTTSTKNQLLKERQRNLLSRNKGSSRCSSLDFNPNEVPVDVALNYLASIMVELYMDELDDESNNPSINK